MNFLSAYYFRAHMYTIVPRHVREDMQWMADRGTNAVVIGVLEQDLYAAKENIQIIASEAQRAGIQLFVTPSRWGGLIAGCPKVPSIFSSEHPRVWALTDQGAPHLSLGPIASVHHPDTFTFYIDSLQKLLGIAPVKGVIWDEPKALGKKDYSPAARQALAGGNIDDAAVHIDAQANFFERVNKQLLNIQPDMRIAMFLLGHTKPPVIHRCAQIGGMHDFGLDGRPFADEDGGSSDSGRRANKTLPEQAPLFIEHARRNRKNAFMLIENHALTVRDQELMDYRLSQCLALGAEHICYYYYPRSVSEPDRAMQILAKHLRKFR